MVSTQEVVARLLMAALLSGIIGIERESRHRAAGLRTHMLVGVGSALLMLVSAYAFPGESGRGVDPTRIAAQVVSGIGFLGAGTIMREGVTIRGLTTAASLWVVSGIGLAVGAGFYLPALVTTVLVTVALLFFGGLERLINPFRSEETYRLKVSGSIPDLSALESQLKRLEVSVKRVRLKHLPEENAQLVQLTLVVPDRLGSIAVVHHLSSLPGLLEVRLED